MTTLSLIYPCNRLPAVSGFLALKSFLYSIRLKNPALGDVNADILYSLRCFFLSTNVQQKRVVLRRSPYMGFC